MTSSNKSRHPDQTRTAGRGVLSITASKLYFILAGYAVQLLLPRLLGTPERFGLYSTTLGGISILNNVMIVATIQSVSKLVSEDSLAAGKTLRQSLKIQLLIGGVLAGALFIAAPTVAEQGLLDAKLGPLFRVASVAVFCYALYAAIMGSLNGRQLFQRQAALDMTYTTLRTAGILGAALLGWGVLGAVSGFAGATFAVLSIAIVAVGLGETGSTISWKRWLAFLAPLWLYQLCLNMTLQADLMVLKRTVGALGLEAGQASTVAADIASRYAGYYRAAQTFAFVPYQLILPVTFVVFPMVSESVSMGDEEQARRYISAAVRFSLLVLLAIAAPISGAAAGVMRLAYPDAYMAGSGALGVLALGMVCFALFVIGATIISSAGQPGTAAAIALAAVLLVVTANLTLVRIAGIGDTTLIAAAAGTSLGTSFALVAVGAALYRRFQALIAPLSALRALLAGLIGFTVAFLIPSHNFWLAAGALIAGGVAYLIALAAIRELGPDDWAAIAKVIRPKKKINERP